MRDQRLDRLADVLVRYSTKVKPGDMVAIQANPVAMPLVEAVYQATLRAGGNPLWFGHSIALEDVLLEHGSTEQLGFTSPITQKMLESVDVRISFWAEINTRSSSRVPPERLSAMQQGRKPLMKVMLDRIAAGDLRWCGTQFPTNASAMDAEMSLGQYEKFVFEAGLLHHDDPVASWERVHERQEHVREYLQKRSELRFRTPATDAHDGTDLKVNVDPSKSIWINCAGTENFPDGEVFTGPQGVDGHVNYSFPAVYQGRVVEGVRLEFKGGRVVNASATKNEDFLFAMLDQDEGGRNLGEIAIGTNYAIKEFSRNTLFDEKIGGTFHAACGAGYAESGNSNESALHWDMVCDMRTGGTVEADGEVFHRDGEILIPGWANG